MVSPSRGAVQMGILGRMCLVPGHYLKSKPDQVVEILMRSTLMMSRLSTLRRHLTLL